MKDETLTVGIALGNPITQLKNLIPLLEIRQTLAEKYLQSNDQIYMSEILASNEQIKKILGL